MYGMYAYAMSYYYYYYYYAVAAISTGLHRVSQKKGDTFIFMIISENPF